MDVWIETAAGNLVKASAMTHISMREHDNTWEVCVSASAAPAPFASGLTNQLAARKVRNTLAISMSTAAAALKPQLISYDAQALSVVCSDLDA